MTDNAQLILRTIVESLKIPDLSQDSMNNLITAILILMSSNEKIITNAAYKLGLMDEVLLLVGKGIIPHTSLNMTCYQALVKNCGLSDKNEEDLIPELSEIKGYRIWPGLGRSGTDMV